MSDMKCPFCQQELQEDVGYDGDYSCPNCTEPYFGSPELWQELINERQHATDCQDLFIAAMAQKIDVETELDRTRKALELAMGFIEKVRNNEDTHMFWIKTANDTINKITALEQKNHFANASKTIEQKDK